MAAHLAFALMGIFQRHVVVEVAKVFFVALVAATGLSLVVGVLRTAFEHR